MNRNLGTKNYFTPGELLYLQPLNIQPYQIERCAQWLVEKKYFVTMDGAKGHLLWLEENDEQKFKGIMSTFFRESMPVVGYLNERPNKGYCSDVKVAYGEPHMDQTAYEAARPQDSYRNYADSYNSDVPKTLRQGVIGYCPGRKSYC